MACYPQRLQGLHPSNECAWGSFTQSRWPPSSMSWETVSDVDRVRCQGIHRRLSESSLAGAVSSWQTAVREPW